MPDTSKFPGYARGASPTCSIPPIPVSSSPRQALEQIADQDIPRVASLARTALRAPPGTAAEHVHRELAGRARFENEARAKEQPTFTIAVEEPVTREDILHKEEPPEPPAPPPTAEPSR